MFSLSNICIYYLLNFFVKRLSSPYISIYLLIQLAIPPYKNLPILAFIFIASYICLSDHSSKTLDAAI